MEAILKHELMPVPVSIAETSGSLKSGTKAVILEDILKDIDVRKRVEFENVSSALIIDGQAMGQCMMTQGMKSFGDYADEFVETVLRKGSNHSRIDVVFDR